MTFRGAANLSIKNVINLTQWLFEDALILKNQRTAELLDIRYELDRTRGGTGARQLVDRATDDDIK